MTAALGHPHLVFRIIRRALDQIANPGLDVQELLCDLILDFFALQGPNGLTRLGCSPAQARDANKNVAKILNRCLDGCAYHDAKRLARFLQRFRTHTVLRSRVHTFVTHDPELAAEVASLQEPK